MKSEIKNLLQEIRSCRDCEVSPKNTPVVYSTENPELLVVSDIPPKGAWNNDLGNTWRNTLNLAKQQRGTTWKLCRSLGIVDIADDIVFWIQRANCYASKGKAYLRNHCSSKFISRAIAAVEPKVIVTLGGTAANWFVQFNKLGDIVGQKFTYRDGSFECPLVPMIHTSRVSARWREKYRDEQDRAIELIRGILAR